MTTTIVPSLGVAPLYTQQGVGASPGYNAVDRRRASSYGPAQEGVGSSGGGWMVTQRAAGATMTVDIAANVDYAWVQGLSVVSQGMYTIPPHSAVINEAIGAAHASLPRVDRVILEVQDNIHDSSGGNLARTRVVTGTATSGATLNNLTGAAAVPVNSLLLADVLVAGGATSITNAVIRDRRKWAHGAFARIIRNTGDYSVSNTSTFALLDATNLNPRIELSGSPVTVTLRAVAFRNATDYTHFYAPQIDSTGIDGMADVGAALSLDAFYIQQAIALGQTVTISHTFVPSAGSHRLGPAVLSGGGTVTYRANSDMPLVWTIEEHVKQNTANNTTTTG